MFSNPINIYVNKEGKTFWVLYTDKSGPKRSMNVENFCDTPLVYCCCQWLSPPNSKSEYFFPPIEWVNVQCLRGVTHWNDRTDLK